MNILPSTAKKLDLEEATVSFYEFSKNNIKYYYFDSSSCVAPDPFVNAIIGLELIKKGDKLIMINSIIPNGLITKMGHLYDIDILALDNSLVKLEFSLK